ncbi:UNVERIFIED_CONTAM: hypothetical protein PYX00_003548 [Menopon gallinae]|uniref:Uncharacterized protein n=1 Tax=Menopon gallinae TaxID=328185 RepID=A0AAW2I0T0_9NEOP
MFLFPAYAGQQTSQTVPVNQDKQWLSNSSFGLALASASNVNVSQGLKVKSENYKWPAKKKKKHTHGRKKIPKEKRKKKKRGHQIENISDDNDLYCVDKTRREFYLNLKTMNARIRPRYGVKFTKMLGSPSYVSDKIKKFKRYFIKRKQLDTDSTENYEMAVIKKAEEYNQKLNEKSDVANWIAFVAFQDEYFEAQHITYGSESEKKRAIFDRKFSILGKALSFNPRNEELMKLWVEVGTEVLSPDELLKQIEKMIEDSPGSLGMWLSLISVRQQCLALCTFSSVSALYRKAVNALKSAKKSKISERDADALELIFHYCRFLDQSGQWEILLTILMKTVYLNFGAEIGSGICIGDDRIKKLENEIFSKSGQPIWVMWGRLELIREGLHFLPVAESTDYPQRCVSTQDFIDFVLHFHRDLHFQLVITIIFLLKVPLLPFRHSIFRLLFKNPLPWTLDSPEIILSSAFHTPAADFKIDYLKHVIHVIRGPQYIKNVEGQMDFLALIQKTFQDCIKILDGKQRMAVSLWWLRFSRWLYILDKHTLASVQDQGKKTKNIFKDLMRSEGNRDNLMFYCEYSLFEYDQGNTETSIKTLRTLISSRKSVYNLSDELEKAAFCQAFKYYCEILIVTSQTEEAVKVLARLSLGLSIDHDVSTSDLDKALHEYENLAKELVNCSERSDSLEQFMLPQFPTEWISCYMWLLALTKSIAHVQTYVQEITSKMSESENRFSDYFREQLWEAMSLIYWTLGKSNIVALKHVLKETLTQFPQNLNTLSLLSAKKMEEHGPWWMFKKSFTQLHSVLASVLLVCVALQRKENEEGFENRIKSLLQQILAADGRLCSVIHCLGIKFAFESDSSYLDAAHIKAIESCPWNKSVYMGAVAALPNRLMELTDIMIEKELRIHVTPDEIEALRD